jgi:hypothetical protein
MTMPGENFTGIVVQSPSLFDRTATVTSTLLQLQTITSSPLVAELPTATGMVLPDRAAYDRLAHFPEELYDLRPESHLVRFMKILLGEAGVGQLRKRYLLAQLEQAMDSTHFYDLDRFYGSLFGARRGMFGALPIDPMADVATPDGWDEIGRKDAYFRERVIKLARAITLGGTPMGMQALAEALTGVECDVYEVWRILDSQGSAGVGRTYLQVNTDFGTYGGLKGKTWGQISGSIAVGNLAVNARNEFMIRPKKVYNTSDPDDARERAEDLWGVQRVVSVLKPARTLASVDDTGLAVHQEVPIASVAADSEYWEVVPCVLPREGLSEVYKLLYTAYDPRAKPTGIERVIPRPPFSASQGQQWSYANEVASVQSFTSAPNGSGGPTMPDFDTVTFYDGKKIAYRPEYGVIDPRQALLAQSGGDGALLSHAYSGSRKVVPTHG